MKNEISLPIVKNQNGDFVHIKNINSDNRNLEYFCPCCDSIVKPRSINEDNKMQPHFYHLDTTKCKQETVYHFVYKHWMFTRGKPFSVVIDDNEVEYVCEKVEIEQSHKTINGLYTPDLTLYTECEKTIYVEVNYSNKKRADECFAKWKELGNIVSEINVRQLFNNDYSEANLKIPAIFDGNDCLEDYKNSLSKDSYYNNIHKYKLTQEYSEERMQQLEKLDWFYRDVCKYIHNSISKEELLQTFGCVEYMDMEVCYDMIKNKACCKTLKNDFMIIISKTLIKYVHNIRLLQFKNLKYSIRVERLYDNAFSILLHVDCIEKEKIEIKKNRHNILSFCSKSLKSETIKKVDCAIELYEQTLSHIDNIITTYCNYKENCINDEILLNIFTKNCLKVIKTWNIEDNGEKLSKIIQQIAIENKIKKTDKLEALIYTYIDINCDRKLSKKIMIEKDYGNYSHYTRKHGEVTIIYDDSKYNKDKQKFDGQITLKTSCNVNMVKKKINYFINLKKQGGR